MSLWAVEISWANTDGVVAKEIVMVQATGPYDADRLAMERKGEALRQAGSPSWPWTTGHRWLLAAEEYVG